MGAVLSGEAVMVRDCLLPLMCTYTCQAIEWTLFALAYVLVGARIGVRIARRQQRHVIISDIFLVASALDCLGLIICEYGQRYRGDGRLTRAGDTWTYALGGMRSVPAGTAVTAIDLKNEVVMDKVRLFSMA